ncbi:hypothetical protein LZG74_11245 [Dyadobacter sp. CY327]|uniref:hypothetical protein n=1 Tax=Dyadobacter sp. CY327 TaxID=2907301 RepID=UPI001F1B2302|nr:hypothetical protein [Dyadobacter sp. CY327]MCE7070882.1 hypothetical protein [Dyadobacter sp. CY327]
MATDINHIRTNVIPFGYYKNKNGKEFFRFSLCIDLNPDIASEATQLEEFIKNFGSKYLGSIINNFRIIINGQEVPKCDFCFKNEFLRNVPTMWNEFLKDENNFARRLRVEEFMPKYMPNLNLSTESVITFFEGSTPENPIPDSTILRQAAISQYQSLVLERDDKKFESVFEEQYKALEASIADIDVKMQGIQMFSEDYNSMQNKVTISEGSKGKHQSIFDSINCMLDVWSYLDSNIVLQRLFGKTIDFEMPRKEFEELVNDISTFTISFSPKEAVQNSLNWEHLKTQCNYHKKYSIILVQESATIANLPIKLEARNYDVGGKLISLKGLREKYKELFKQLNDPTKMESEKFLLRKELIKIDSSVLTLGINIYDSSKETLAKVERDALIEAKKLNIEPITDTVFLSDIRRGYRIAAQNNSEASSKLTPLGQRVLSLKHNKLPFALPDEFQFQQVSISADTGTHALIEEGGVLSKKLITDQAMLNWSGENIGYPSVFSNVENEENFEPSRDEGSTDDSTKFVIEYFSRFLFEKYTITGVEYKNRSRRNAQDKLNTDSSLVNLLFEYSFPKSESEKANGNKKLVFGREYEVILTPEYKNGWAVPFETSIQIKEDTCHFLNVSKFTFKRNEPVKPIEFLLQERLVENDGKTPIKLREGESLHKMVIRNFSNFDDDKVYKTKQTSIRHILPPAISFQHSFWHNKIFEMSTKESYKWYLKHHFPKNINTPKRDNHNNIIDGKFYSTDDIDEIIEGSTTMREFYPDKWYIPDAWEKHEIINYLPDPLSIGFRFEFYEDKSRLSKAVRYEKYEQLEFYFSGKYPRICTWKLILQDYNIGSELISVNTNEEEIIIRVEKGDELFVSARTILSEDYENQLETYGNYNDFIRYGNNELLTPPLEFSLTHATQRPLVRPKFNNILKCDKKQDQTILEITTTANIEQTGIYLDKAGIVRYLEGNVPTGTLEVYAKWEEYDDNPKHVTTDNGTPNDPINHIDKLHFKHTDKESPATFEAIIDVSKQIDKMEATLNKIASHRNDFKNYAVDLQLSYDVKETKFIEKFFWIKSKSKFTSYYPKYWGTIDEDTVNGEEQKLLRKDFHLSKEIFNRLSSEAFLVRVLSSKKPNAPIVSDKNITLVSVIEDRTSNKTIHRKASMNRLRFFFERGRLTSGKGERIGFVVNEPQAKYNDYLITKDLVSIVGRDIVSDSLKPYDGLFRNEDVLLTKSNFVVNDPYDLKDFGTNMKSDDLESFSPKYVKDLGLMSYLPKFDKELSLWYVDVEMDINDDKGRELHSPFLRFSIVHFQENSFNYNNDEETDISKDCRLSEITKSGYVYILPTRNIKLEYGLKSIDGYKKGFIKVGMSYDESSVKIGNSSINSSKFYLVIRHRLKSEAKWHVSDKVKEKDGSAFLKLDNKVAEIDFIFYRNNTDYQVVIIETEDWNNDNDTTFDNLIENKNSRVVHVNTFEINNNML